MTAAASLRDRDDASAAAEAPLWQVNPVQRLALVMTWVAVASGAVVFSEPAPVDVITMGLVIGLPLVGLVATSSTLWLLLTAWLACGAGALVASTQSGELDRSTIHTAVSIYLYLAFFVFAAFVARKPRAHTKLIFDAYLCAALVAAAAGVIGYFSLVPGAAEMFTKYGRASGTFKDPNVFGPFLVPALLYALHRVLTERPSRTVLPAAMVLFLSFAILLSFSRGAWFNAALAVAVFCYFSIVFAPTEGQRIKMVLLGAAAAALAAGVLAFAIQFESIGELLSKRAELTQSYDVGPEGRFGGQAKAKLLILENPLGLGALQFARVYHHEDVHQVYLTMLLSAGWIGGILFAVLTALTIVCGLRHAFVRTPTRPYFLIAFAAFLANALEGFIIDLDHWRHFYLLMAIMWGLMAAEQAPARQAMRQAAGRFVRSGRPARLLRPAAA